MIESINVLFVNVDKQRRKHFKMQKLINNGVDIERCMHGSNTGVLMKLTKRIEMITNCHNLTTN